KRTSELYDAEQIAIIGDFFHSDPNTEWGLFSEWHQKLNIPIKLITGNHDKALFTSQPETTTELCGDELVVSPFVLQHHPNEKKDNRNYYRIAGHVHPGYNLRGKARQRVVLPCFCIEENQLILPAFGSFTGKEMIEPKVNARYFVIAGNSVTEIPQQSPNY
ncbi:MAG: ligase-associated DNA damage response endonuclease PdeM, partial [Bacteroidia bacterium]